MLTLLAFLAGVLAGLALAAVALAAWIGAAARRLDTSPGAPDDAKRRAATTRKETTVA